MANTANNGAAPVPAPGSGPSPQTQAFIRQMVENLNTHQPGVPRGMNTGNCPQPEFSPVSAAVNDAGKNGHDNGAAAVGAGG